MHKKKNSVIEMGGKMMEIIDTENMEAILFVPEDQIADVKVNMKGELAAQPSAKSNLWAMNSIVGSFP